MDTGAVISFNKSTTVLNRLKDHFDRDHVVEMEVVNGSIFKSEGSFDLECKLGNRHLEHISPIINCDSLLGMDFLEKHRSLILLDEGKLIMDDSVKLKLAIEYTEEKAKLGRLMSKRKYEINVWMTVYSSNKYFPLTIITFIVILKFVLSLECFLLSKCNE